MRHEESYWRRLSGRRLSRRHALRATALGGTGLAGAYLVGCGEGDDDDGDPGQSTGTTPTAQAAGQTATPAPVAGGKFQIGHIYPTGAITLDPHTQESDGSQRALRFIYSNLIREEQHKGPGQIELAGDLADSWEQPDAQTAVFHLRKDVKFHNLPPVNGRQLTAEDIVYSFQRMKTNDPKFVMRTKYSNVEVTAVDPYTVKFTTAAPYAPLLHNIAYPWSSIVAREVVETGDIENKPVGTGPFQLAEYVRGSTLQYTKNAGYYKPGLPYFDSIETPIMPDASARLAAFRAGQFAWEGVQAAQVDDLKRTNPEIQVFKLPSVSISVIRFNCLNPILKDFRIRQAIAYATNTQEYMDAVVSGSAVRSGPMPAAIKNWALAESEYTPFDLAKAKQLMSAAGYANGFKLTSTATQPYNSVDLTEVTVAQLKKINIDLTIETIDNAAWIAKSYRAAGATEWATSTYSDYAYSDPDAGLRDVYHSKGGGNNHNFSDPDIDRLLDQQRTMMDAKERASVAQDIQRRLIVQAPRVWLYDPIGILAVQPWLMNYHPMVSESSSNLQDVEQMWIKKT